MTWEAVLVGVESSFSVTEVEGGVTSPKLFSTASGDKGIFHWPHQHMQLRWGGEANLLIQDHRGPWYAPRHQTLSTRIYSNTVIRGVGLSRSVCNRRGAGVVGKKNWGYVQAASDLAKFSLR